MMCVKLNTVVHGVFYYIIKKIHEKPLLLNGESKNLKYSVYSYVRKDRYTTMNFRHAATLFSAKERRSSCSDCSVRVISAKNALISRSDTNVRRNVFPGRIHARSLVRLTWPDLTCPLGGCTRTNTM